MAQNKGNTKKQGSKKVSHLRVVADPVDRMHAKFKLILEKFLGKQGWDEADLAWFVGATTYTVKNWLKGESFPNRDNAIKLIHYSDEMHGFFNRLAGLEDAIRRANQPLMSEPAAAEAK